MNVDVHVCVEKYRVYTSIHFITRKQYTSIRVNVLDF